MNRTQIIASPPGVAAAYLVNVKTRGAKGDGATDDTTAIQAAINAAGTNGAGTVFFPRGTYKVSSSLRISTSHVWLEGEGQGGVGTTAAQLAASAATRILATTADPIVIFDFPNNSPATISGGIRRMMLDGNLVGTVGLQVLSRRFGVFSDICIIRTTDIGMEIGPSANTTTSLTKLAQTNYFRDIFISTRNDTGSICKGIRLFSDGTNDCTESTFQNIRINVYDAVALLCQGSDTNTFIRVITSKLTGSNYGLYLSSNDAGFGFDRFNVFHNCQFAGGVFCEASQTGGNSSASNAFLAFSRGNSVALPVLQAGAGGAADATAYWFDSFGNIAVGDIDASGDTTVAQIGFQGSAAIAKPTVHGPRGTSIALADLLTDLASYGLITDSTYATDESETTTLLAQMSSQPTAQRHSDINTLIKALKDAGVWAKLDLLYILAAADAQAASLNWIAPGSNSLTAINSPTFTADRGYVGNGSNAYLGTGTNLSDLTLFTQNSAAMGAFVQSGTTESVSNIGLTTTNLITLMNKVGAGPMRSRLNNSTIDDGSSNPASNVGHGVITRSGSTGYDQYYNGAFLDTITRTSSARVAEEIVLLRNVTTYQATRRLAAAHMGGSLTSGEISALYGALNAYMTAVGAV